MTHLVNRRTALKFGSSAALLASWTARTSRSFGADYSSLDTDKFLGQVKVLTTIEDDKVFTEGPAWGNGALYFTNVPA